MKPLWLNRFCKCTSQKSFSPLKGKVLYEDDTHFKYDKAYETIKEFESFKRRYYDYLGIESLE